MDNLEKILNKLPRKRLSIKADLKIKWQLYKMIRQKRSSRPVASVWQTSRRLAFVSASLVLLCVLIGVPVFAYASDTVTLGSWLYPVKQAIETVEIALPQSAPAKVATYEKLAQRRLAEANTISKDYSDQKSAVLVQTINQAVSLDNQADALSAQTAATSAPDKMQTIIDAGATEQVDSLSRVAAQVGPTVNESVVDTIASALDKFKKKNQEFDRLFKQKNNKNTDMTSRPLDSETASTTVAVSADAYVSISATSSLTSSFDNVESSVSGSSTTGVVLQNRLNRRTEKRTNQRIFTYATSTRKNTETGRQKTSQNLKPENNQPNQIGTSTSATANGGEAESIQNSINDLENKIKALIAGWQSGQYVQSDIDAMIDRLQTKLKKAKAAFADNDLMQADLLVKSTEILANNAEHFIKLKNDNLPSTNQQNSKTLPERGFLKNRSLQNIGE